MRRTANARPTTKLSLGLISLALLAAGMGPALAGPEDQALALLLRADNVEATGVGPSSVFVTWMDLAPLDTLFRIEVATDEAGPYQAVATKECATNVGPTAIKLPQVDIRCSTQFEYGPPSSPTPIFVRVVPVLAVGGVTLLEGVPSEADPALLGPVPPTDLRCNGGTEIECIDVNSVTLSWVDNSDEHEFWIMRAKSRINPQFGTTPHAIVPANTTTYHEFLSDYDAIYWYRVVAVREQNIPRLNGSVTVENSFSNSLTAGADRDRIKVETAPVPPPSDPSGLSVSFIPPSTAKLTWTDKEFNPTRPYVDEDGWHIESGPNELDFEYTDTSIFRTGQGTVTYEQDNVPPDTRMCFRVRGYRNGPAFSGFTNVACLETIPARPGDVLATALDNATVQVTWVDRSDSESQFVVQRCNGSCSHNDNWTNVGNAPANATLFLDTSTFGDTTYSYRVRAQNSAGLSAASNISTVTTPPAPVAAPSGLIAAATGSHEITLTFVDNATNETGFRVEYKKPDGSWDKLDEIGPRNGTGGVTYVDKIDLKANEKRCYRVRALKVSKVSDPSNSDCATTFAAAAPDGAPTGLSRTVVSNVRIDLSWTDNATNEDSFLVQTIAFPNLTCPQNPGALPFKDLASAPARNETGSTSFAVTGLQPHSAYFFRVIAVNKDGVSGPSNVTGCAQTLGPPLPIWVSPAAHGDVEATRCEVVIQAQPSQVDRIKLIVNAYVPGSSLGDTQVVWGEEPRGSTNQWHISYQFRRGINYRLIAQSFGHQPTNYGSATAELRDIKVLADCPIDPDPI